MPEIVSRATWGAAPTRGRLEALKLPVDRLWLHHTVTAFSGDPHADARDVQAVAFSRGFQDVSYTWLVHPDGTILDGRGLTVGAHTRGENRSSVAVALIGNYEELVPTDAQVASVRWLVALHVGLGALRPGRYPTGGHRDAPGAATACPGRHAGAALERFREPWTPAPAPPAPTRGGLPVLNHPPRCIVNRPQGDGYWIVAYDGGVFAFGEAPALTAIGGDPVERIVSADAWPDGEGLTCLGEDGGVFALGSARYMGRVEYQG